MLLQASLRTISADTAVFTITGPLTLGTSLKSADDNIQTAISRGLIRLVLELSGVTFIDSAGLGTLVHAHGLAAARGGSLRLAGAPERVTSLLHMTRVDAILPTDPDEATALAALAQR